MLCHVVCKKIEIAYDSRGISHIMCVSLGVRGEGESKLLYIFSLLRMGRRCETG